MKATQDLCKINLFDSASIQDVKNYTRHEPAHRRWVNDEKNATGFLEYQYYGLDEEKYEHKFEKFTYVINEYGFREERISQSIDCGAFGCSFTFGQGLPKNALWHQIIAREQNKTIFNFGISGASIQSILDIFCIVSKHIKMQSALVLLPSYNRFQLAKTNPWGKISLLSVIPGHKSIFNQNCDIDETTFYKILPDEEFVKNLKNSVYQAEHLAKARNIKLSISSWDLTTYVFLQSLNLNNAKLMPCWITPHDLVNDRARDGRHPGIGHHNFHAIKFAPFID